MAHEIIIAMNVTDPAGYTEYRAAMRPVLVRFGGRFKHDFVVSQTLATEAAHPVTRVFVLAFPDRAAREAFFADAEYLVVRQRHFTRSVNGFTILCEQDVQA